MPPWHADPRHGSFANDRWLSARERATRPGNPSVVHHIFVFAVPPGADRGPAVAAGRGHHCGHAPSDMPSVFSAGSANSSEAGSDLVFQLHSTPNGKPARDRFKIGRIVAPEPPRREALTIGIANSDVDIVPGLASHPVRSERRMW